MSSGKRKRKQGSRLGNCDVCHLAEAKYTCPRCETVTCSLTCVKKHKTELDCDGVRSRTKYVPKDKYDELSHLSDYRLFEDSKRCLEKLAWQRSTLDLPPKNITPPVQSLETEEQVNSEASINDFPETETMPETYSVSDASSVKSGSDISISDADDDPPPPTDQIIEDPLPTNEVNEIKFSSSGSETSDAESETNGESEIPPTEELVASPTESQTSSSLSSPSKSPPVPKSKKAKKCAKNRSNNLLRTMRKGGMRKEKILATLQKVAFSRGVLLSFLPDRYEDHRENTSYFFNKENCIYWHLKLFFINANFFTLTMDKCAETTSLGDVIKESLNRSRNLSIKKKKGKTKEKDPLAVYRKIGVPQFTVLMPIQRLPDCEKKCYVLDMKKSLRENFEGKCVVEFPQLCIALPNCYSASKVPSTMASNFFDVSFMSDDEEFIDPQNEYERHLREVSKRRKDEEKEMSKKISDHHGDSDRESGELTDSSSESDSGQELFKESEFRSIYKDLLTTFDKDVTHSLEM